MSEALRSRLQIVAAVIGIALEWYDFIVFGFFAVIVGPEAASMVFPSQPRFVRPHRIAPLMRAVQIVGARWSVSVLPGFLVKRTRRAILSRMVFVPGLCDYFC